MPETKPVDMTPTAIDRELGQISARLLMQEAGSEDRLRQHALVHSRRERLANLPCIRQRPETKK